MFGYIVVNKPEMKFKEFDVYQSFYCGLCAQLHSEYGRIGQLSLNFDMTFLAILLSGLYEPEDQLNLARCVMHPVHKHMERSNPYNDYAADMTILLTYLKCEDDWQDEHRYRSAAFQKMLGAKFNKVKERYPEKVIRVEEALAQISKCEKEQVCDLDKLSSLFGIVLGEIFAYRNDEWNQKLYDMGDYFGRFIYLMDAYDDLQDDKEKGQFNPFVPEEHRVDFDEWAKEILEMMMAQCCEVFETLPILQHLNILRNILYSGVWMKYVSANKKRIGEQNG